jgi:PAS domain S-box-containing protein
MSIPPAGASRRYRFEWVLLAAVLLAVGLFLIWSRIVELHAVRAAEAERLAAQVRAIDETLSSQLLGVYNALQSMRERRPHWDAEALQTTAVRRMQALVGAMPGVRTMQILGADGRVLASNREELIGRSFADRRYFQQAHTGGDPRVLYVSPPFRTALGVWALNLSLVLHDAEGAFDGLVTATLDPEYFEVALRSALYAPDVWAAIAHGDGSVLLFSPAREDAPGRNLAQPGSLFLRHRDSGDVATVYEDVVQLTGERRLLAQRTLRPAAVPMDWPLVLAVSRDVSAMLAPWRRQSALQAALFAMLLAGTAGALWGLQRRQRAFDVATEDQQAQRRADAERLELALRGADLALWDLHVPTGQATVNARWSTMLGHRPGELDTSREGWGALLHPDDRPAVEAAQQAHLDGRSDAYEAQYRLRHRDGHWVWVLDRGKVVERDAQGRALRMIGTHMDVTPRVAAEQALRRSEQSLATTLHSIGDAVIATDAGGRIERLNAAAERLTGWTVAEAVGQPLGAVFRIVDPRRREAVIDPVREVLESGQVVGLANDAMLVARDGREVPIADSAAPIRTASGEVTGVVLVFSDVSERFAAQRALAERERMLSAIADALPGPVSRADREGRYLFANAAYERWFGLRPGEVVGRTQREVLGRHYPGVEAYVRRALAGETVRYEGPVRTSEGTLHALVTLVPDRDADGAVHGHFTVVVDITDRKRAEDALRASERKLRALLDALAVGVVVHAPDTRVLDANPAACRILGLTFDQMRGKAAVDQAWHFVDEHGAPLPPERYPVNLALTGGEPLTDYVGGVRRSDRDRPVWVSCDAYVLRDAQGGVDEVVVTFADITERRLAQERILAAQGELEATLAAVPDLLFEIGLDGGIHGYHSRRDDLLYAPPERFLGRTVAEIMPPDAGAVIMDALRLAAEHGFTTGQQYELDLSSAGRHTFELSVARKPAPAGAVPRFVVLARDVTDRVHAERERATLERQLRESQKIESIGTLAGGIAHDFNNILAAILGHVTLARDDIGRDHPARGSLEQIERSGLRARGLVQQILAFSRRQPPQLQRQALQPLVEETLQLLRATLPAGVTLHSALAAEPVEVDADATQLQQVLVNLCTNAWHALPGSGGRIEVGVDAVDVDLGADARLRELSTGRCAHLWVRDNGSGIDAATLERIFDPFFTTKPAGQGTGLGLSVVHGIVRAHRGVIVVDTAPGQGSTFHLYLPRAAAAGVVDGAAADVAVPPAGAGQRVIVVDDDEVMGVLVERLLQRAGYRPIVFTRAAQALQRLRADPAAADLVVTDHNMPDASGLELCRAVGALRPGLPVILTSGYLNEALRAEATQAGAVALLEKERMHEALVALVARVLGTT